MDAFTDPAVETVVVMKSAQVGATECLLNVIGYFIDYDPSPILIVEPTEVLARKFSKTRFAPMIRDTKCLAGRIQDANIRESGNTILAKSFAGGHISIIGSNSPSQFRAQPIRIVLADDIDAFPPSAGVEGDPVKLAETRTTTFWNRKIGLFSTPTVEGESRIEMAYNLSDQRKYWVPCVHCGEYQVMRWDIDHPKTLGWPKGDPQKAVYYCIHCNKPINDSQKARMVRKGEWRAEAEFNGTAGFWINELSSPWVSFGKMAQKFIDAKDNRETLKEFVNTSQGLTFKQTVIKKSMDEIFAAKADIPPQVVPEEAVALTCGIDCQKAGYYFVVRAWAQNLTGWMIHYGFLPTWGDVETLLFNSQYPWAGHEMPMSIWRAAIDTGGGEKEEGLTMTEETYAWLIRNKRRGVALWGTKGSSHAMTNRFKKGEDLLRTPSGKKLPPDFYIILIDTNTMKDFYHYGIGQAALGDSQALYLHRETGRDYALQILAEEKRVDQKTGTVEWVRTNPNNHWLDAELIAISLAQPQWIGGGVNLLRVQQSNTDKQLNNMSRQRQVVKSKWMDR
jgi:phage terminase large subunit GpA-like protein